MQIVTIIVRIRLMELRYIYIFKYIFNEMINFNATFFSIHSQLPFTNALKYIYIPKKLHG